MIPAIKELNFPEYATLSQADIALNDMGELIITTQVKIDGDIKPDFSYNWEVVFMGEKFIHPLHTPQALKDNTSVCSKIDLTFQHWVVYELKRNYFVQLASVKAGTVIPDKYITPLGLNLYDFITAFQGVLDYYYKGAIKIKLNPDGQYSQDRAFINISYSYMWDVLQTSYKVYGVRWYIKGDTIYFGYPAPEISHVFEYGYNKGLISLERQVQDANIRNSLLGRGGSTNLPQYYFKNAPEGSLYASDPDAIPELANIYFTELRGKTFRDYVQGWKTNPKRDTQNGTIAIEPYDEERGETDFAYKKGHEDETFDPIEYVKDDVSIAKYGLLPGGLENNDNIYPSIQNIALDKIGLVNEIVAAEEITSDDIDQAATNESIASNIPPLSITDSVVDGTSKVISRTFNNVFTIEENDTATILNNASLRVTKSERGSRNKDALKGVDYDDGGISVEFINTTTDTSYNNGNNLPSGVYDIKISCSIYSLRPPIDGTIPTNGQRITVEIVLNEIKLISSTNDEWRPTFDIWIKDIWQTEKLDTETVQTYEDRVWQPILGDEGREAMVTFSSGWLSSSEEWEFKVIDYAYDTSKSYNGVSSHWKLTLQKSDAELKVTGKYIPNTGMQAVSGDTFLFTGIDMPHLYTLFGEQRIDEWKYNALQETKDIQPTWISKLDKVRINTLEPGDTELLVNSLKVGALIRLSDKRFIDGQIDRYIQTITYRYSDKIVPEIEIILSDKISSVDNPVQRLQGEVDLLSAQIARPSANWINQLRQVFDAIYLRKDGVEDMSKSPTSFKSIVKSDGFRSGIVGGQGWGVYRDSNGRTVAEFDQIKARLGIQSNSYVINEVKHQGGMWVQSAASIEVSSVKDNGNGAYYCYFNTKGGSINNLFQEYDIAVCQKFTADNVVSKYYKGVVSSVGYDYIIITNLIGEDMPEAGDVIIHGGNINDRNRQYIVVRDVIGGGYERMLSGLNSLDTDGKEYYFAGRANGEKPRWFVGDKEDEYAEWYKGKMTIRGKLEVGSNVGGATVVDGGLVTAETISLGSEGNIKAGSSGAGTLDEDVRFWAGATYENRHNAPFHVLQDGSLFSTKGKIAKFNISEYGLTSNDSYGYVGLTNERLAYQNAEKTVSAFYGATVMPEAGTHAAGWITNHAENDSIFDYKSNIGLVLDVKGVPSLDSIAKSGSHALSIQNGDIGGLRLRTRRINKDTTLSHLDNIILCSNESKITITLPTEPKEGQLYMFKKTGTGNVTIKVGKEEDSSEGANDKHRIRHALNDEGLEDVVSVTLQSERYWRIMVWDYVNKKWQLGD